MHSTEAPKESKKSQPLTSAKEIAALAEILSKEKVIAFDTEFIRESTFYPQLEILQVGTRTDTWLIDVPAFRQGKARQEPEALKPLFQVLRNPEILKIVHAAQADQECLFTSFGLVATPTLDTEVAASLCGYGDGVGLGNLLKGVLGVQLKKGHARTDWSVRPLPHQQIEYAHGDVIHLVELGETLLAEVEKLGRKEWALRLSKKWEDPILHEPPPEQIAERLARGGKVDRKGYPVLMELVKWRERRVREVNVPRRWLADDATLLDISQVRPKDVGHLGSFRGLSKGEIKHRGEEIIQIIQKALSLDIEKPASGPRMDPPSDEEGRALDLLKCYMGILADENNLAAKHILLADQMLRLLRSEPQKKEDLEALGLLSPEAIRLVGGELVALLKGERALSIQKDRVRVVTVSPDQPPVDGKSSG